MIKLLAIICAVIALFPVVTGFSIRERSSKIGLGFVAFGFASILLARQLYPHFISPSLGEIAERNLVIHGYLLRLMEIGLWLFAFGAVVIYISSTKRMWVLRKELFPFLFNRRH